ncbi:DNA-binding transcriptional regulator, AcrR family [Amycolatopsis xylanica]|uniref:DNA-binding transcriptional regulator, AcrR family n=1 Tax=Amycolatopsis xylanica TaxID=589385 RepID=A0A1H3CTU9_9PSEU|nr:TetR family transcriptional regulator [Amycolatopsis xylanica]SDX57591.1 DNA-binding transcriptional regulator, AcrR family [Amycolatopsis xylanica]
MAAGTDIKPKTSAKGEQTRARLLAAARTLLAQHDAGELTTRNVASLCGLSRSLTHYYFRDRTDLILAVIEDIRADWILPFEQAVASTGTFEERADRVVALLTTPESPDLGRVHSALHWFALNDERIKDSLEAEYQRWRRCFVDLFQVLADERGDGLDPRPRGEALAAAADGLAAVQSLGSVVDAETMFRTLVRSLAR